MEKTTPTATMRQRDPIRNIWYRWQFQLALGLALGLVIGIPAAQVMGHLATFLPRMSGGNLVHNGSFEQLDGWDFVVRPGSSATIGQDGGQRIDGNYSLKVDVMLAAPANPWYIQARQGHIPLQSGQAVELSFFAKGTAQTGIEAVFQQATDPFAIYVDRSVRLTTTWQKYHFTFRPTRSDPNANLVFDLASAAGQIWIDQVALTPTSSAASGTGNIPTLAPPRVPTATTTPVPVPAGWTLSWHDEFDGSSVDTTKWNVVSADPGGYQHDSLGDGLQAWTTQAVSVHDGILRFTSARQQADGHSYTSGAVTTEDKFSFLYGRVDIRVRLPRGDGLWPAIWMLPLHDPLTTIATYETDILEMLGQDPTTAYVVQHSVGYERSYCTFTGPDFSAGYHVFSLEWSPGRMVWFVDGVQHCLITRGVPNVPMYLLLNTYVGGSWPGPPDRTTVLPQHTDFDYVRVYTRSTT